MSISTDPIRLRGIAWNHSRGFTPMVATAQRYGELYPHVEITWEKRSLQAFADAPIEKLAEQFDLLVIDHPFAGFAAQHPVLHNLNQIAPPDLLADLRTHSTGESFASYDYDGHLCALPIDGATPIADIVSSAGHDPADTLAAIVAMFDAGVLELTLEPAT